MSYKVLVVDDSKLARMAIARALSSLRPEWTRVEAASADEALARSRETAFDVALIDFNMPGRDGLALASQLRELSPEMPLAVITANLQHEIVTRAGELGADFLSKPVNERELDAFLDTATRKLKEDRE
jgi:CheY-like chemotaxis protein